MVDCRWLPGLEEYDGSNEWINYENYLYDIFCNDFKNTHPTFENKNVVIRYHPIENGKEEAFYHVTCQDYMKDGYRVPDFRRCERIRWVRKFIENYCCDTNICKACSGVKVWSEPYKANTRVHIMLEEEKYMVVVEPRESYCLLITAFYFDQGHRLRNALNRYNKYK